MSVTIPLVVAGRLLAAPRPPRTPVAAVRGFLDQAVERQAFGAPVTPWRIASSVNALRDA